jgi:hypothetical protein
MGVAASEAAIQQKALELGLIKVGEEASAQQKSIATLELVYEATSGDAEKLAQYQNTLTGAQQELAATWKDLLAELAQDFAPLAIQGLKILIFDLQVLQKIFQFISPFIQDAAGKVASFIAATKGLGGLNVFEKIKKFATQYNEAREGYRDYFETFNDSLDTPTAELPPVEIDTTGAEKELEDLLKDLEKLQDKIDETESDHKLKIARFDEDIRIDRGRAVEDYNLNVLQATRAFNQKRSESNKKYRQKEAEEERKFQEDMRKLREEFLYSLEDALRERDARQVLRLVDKYNMDKEAAGRERAIQQQTAAENHALEQQEEKRQLEEKLRTMAEEQALKLQRMDEDSALKRARMEEDHALEMEKLRAQLDERISEAATKMAEELGVNEAGAQAIHDLLSQYYGTDGSLAKLTEEGYAKMLGNAQGFLAQLTGLVAQQQGLMAAAVASVSSMYAAIPSGASTFFSGGMSAANPFIGSSSGAGGTPTRTPSGPNRIPQYAAGGQFVATRATPFIAGEGSENELVTITPFSQMRAQNTASFAGGDLGSTSTINLGVTLSSELKAEIINKTLDRVALVVERVRREK